MLDRYTNTGQLFEKDAGGNLRCLACAHRCLIKPGNRGVCQMRFNQAGELRVPWGYVAGIAPDPVEKKPFYHFLPGQIALTFGMFGCNFQCAFCQNWQSSQTFRDPAAPSQAWGLQTVTPEQIVAYAKKTGAASIVSSYNEPLITAEWANAVFQLARQTELACGIVSNGHATPEVLKFLQPNLQAIKIDLKTMQEKNYRFLGGRLKNVLDSISLAHQMGLWVEIVTLVIPDFNDSNEELWDTARFLASVSVNIPWHVTAFHPDYKMTDRPRTDAGTLQRAAEIGQEAGLHYVYAGNLAGRVDSLEDTFCPTCQNRLIQRYGFSVISNQISPPGNCPRCGTKIAGIWQ